MTVLSPNHEFSDTMILRRIVICSSFASVRLYDTLHARRGKLVLLLKISFAIVVRVEFEIVSVGIRNLTIGVRLSLYMKVPRSSWKERRGGLTRYNPHQIARETDSLGAFPIDSIKGGVVSSLFRTALNWELNELSRHEVIGRAAACLLKLVT
jgi:hypothetical protein